MNPNPDLNAIIASLRSEGATGLVYRLVDPTSAAKVYAGTENSGTELGVLLTTHRRHVPVQKDLPAGAGFAVRAHVVKDDPKDHVRLGVFCTDPACEDIFRHFMGDLTAHLLAEGSVEGATRTFLARVVLWQRFFVGGSGGYLSEEGQIGLFSELHVLRELLVPSVGPSTAVDSWKGPDSSPQDFILTPCVIEVKGSSAKASGRIAISNEMQLDDRPFPHLVLVHISLAAGGGTCQSLVDIVADVRLLLATSGRPLSVFNVPVR